jgi:hypothetical protein
MRSEVSEYNDCRPSKRAFDGDVRRGRERPNQAASALRFCDLDLVVSSGCWWPRPKSPLDIAPPLLKPPARLRPQCSASDHLHKSRYCSAPSSAINTVSDDSRPVHRFDWRERRRSPRRSNARRTSTDRARSRPSSDQAVRKPPSDESCARCMRRNVARCWPVPSSPVHLGPGWIRPRGLNTPLLDFSRGR